MTTIYHNIYSIPVTTIEGIETTLASFKGRVMLIVNVASRCGFTKQYTGLEALYQRYKDEGFVILGFPCNQFAKQEPGNEDEIKEFCQTQYNVSFPLFSKINVNGSDAHPLYQYLKSQAPGALKTEAIKWNFTKFLVDGNGKVLKRYAPNADAEAIEKDLLAMSLVKKLTPA